MSVNFLRFKKNVTEHLEVYNQRLIRTVSVNIWNDPPIPWKDGNVRFTTIPLSALSDCHKYRGPIVNLDKLRCTLSKCDH